MQNIRMVQEDPSKNVEITSPQSNPATLKDLDNEIKNAEPGTTIKLNKDYKANNNEEPIIINKSLIIDGQGHTIDGSKSTQIFNITCNNVILKNINFINTKTDVDGSAIDCHGDNCSVMNCSFKNCSAKYKGGAIGCIFKNCSVMNCSFINCSADRGGAIYCVNSDNCVINYNVFDNNTAKKGSAIHNLYSDINYDFNFFAFENNNNSLPNNLIDGATIKHWVILNISKDNNDYSVDFIGNDGSALTNSMPDYTAKLTINNTDKEITIKNNTFKDKGPKGDYVLNSLNSGNVLVINYLNNTLNNNFDSNATGSFNIIVNDIVYGESFIINVTNATGVNGEKLNGTINVTLNNKDYSFNITNGTGSEIINDTLPTGNYIVNASLIVPNYDVMIANTSFSIDKISTKFIDATNCTVYNGKYYNVHLTDELGNVLANKTVAIKIAGQNYNVKTDKNGLAKIQLKLTSKNLNKKLKVTYKFNGDNNLKASSGSSTIQVIKTPTKINATKLVVKNHKNFNIKLTTEDGKFLANKTVTMKSSVSGKTYKIKTNSKGIAKIDLWVKKHPLGKTYKYTFQYAGSNYYNSCTKTFKIKLIK